MAPIMLIFPCPSFQTISVGRRKFSANFQLMFRLIKGLIFLTFISILVTLIALPHMTMRDIIVCILAFMPTGWGLLLVRHISPLTWFWSLHFMFFTLYLCRTWSLELPSMALLRFICFLLQSSARFVLSHFLLKRLQGRAKYHSESIKSQLIY